MLDLWVYAAMTYLAALLLLCIGLVAWVVCSVMFRRFRDEGQHRP